MATWSCELPRPADAERSSVQLLFRPTRSLIHTLSLDGQPPRSRDAHGRRFVFAAPVLHWDELLSGRAQYEGEPISLLAVRWLEPGEPPLPHGAPGGLQARRAGARRQLGELDLASPAAVLDATSARTSDDYAKAFFFAMDQATHPGLQDPQAPWPADRLAQLGLAKPPLWKRLRRRWDAMQDFVAVQHGSFDPRTGTPSGAAAAIAAAVPDLADLVPDAKVTASLGALLLELVRGWYPGGTQGFDPVLLRSAMERFAAGRLGPCAFDAQHDTWSAQPDSANIFLFAEFAFLALDQGIEVPAWTALARIFTGIEPIYAASYGHHGVGCTPAGPDKQGLRLSFRMLGPPARDGNALSNPAWLAALRRAHDEDACPLAFRHGAHIWHTCPAGIESDF